MKTAHQSASPSFTTQINVPGRREPCGEFQDASNVQLLLDNDKYLRDLVLGADDALVIPIPLGLFMFDSTVWAQSLVNPGRLRQIDVSTNLQILAEITPLVPRHGDLYEIRVRLYGETGHSAMPGNPPTISLKRCDIADTSSTPTFTTILTETDTQDVPGYQSDHEIVQFPGTESCDPSAYRYFVSITGESGTNSVIGLVVYECELIIDIS